MSSVRRAKSSLQRWMAVPPLVSVSSHFRLARSSGRFIPNRRPKDGHTQYVCGTRKRLTKSNLTLEFIGNCGFLWNPPWNPKSVPLPAEFNENCGTRENGSYVIRAGGGRTEILLGRNVRRADGEQRLPVANPGLRRLKLLKAASHLPKCGKCSCRQICKTQE